MIGKRYFNSGSPCIMIKIKVCIEREDAEKETRDRDFNIVADFGRRGVHASNEWSQRSFGSYLCCVICVPKENPPRAYDGTYERETTDVR